MENRKDVRGESGQRGVGIKEIIKQRRRDDSENICKQYARKSLKWD